ncbi:MAG: Ig-like domain-containing protein, partial [Pirellulales bacterium]|nr:Ig-like domain-containing protein [Pirellulales bacterium]
MGKRSVYGRARGFFSRMLAESNFRRNPRRRRFGDPLTRSLLMEPLEQRHLLNGAARDLSLNGSGEFTAAIGTSDVGEYAAVQAGAYAPPVQWLGAVDFLALPSVDLSGGESWYGLETAHGAILTLEALAADVAIGLYDADFNELKLSEAAGAGQRIDWPAMAGLTFYFRLSGTATVVDVRIANLVQHDGAAVVVYGTAGDDAFAFDASAAVRQVTINGAVYGFNGALATAFSFDGAAGDDTVRLRGSQGNNTYTAWPGSAEMTGDGVSLTVRADRIYVRGGGGVDTATIWDSLGDDLFEFFPVWARVTGTGFFHHLQGFTTMIGKAELGVDGTDEVRFRGSPQNDWLKSTTITTRMLTLGAWRHANGFDTISAYGRGGVDKAVLEDTPGDDTLRISPAQTAAKASLLLATPEYTVTGYDFSQVDATRVRRVGRDGTDIGGNDKATLEGSPLDDTLIGDPAEVRICRTGVVDVPGYSWQPGDYLHKITGFPEVLTYSTGDGHDRAVFRDFAGPADTAQHDDTFTASGIVGELTGPGYRLWARYFDEVRAEAGLGRDVASLSGTAGVDQFNGTAAEVCLSGLNAKGAFANYANGFDEIHAFGAAGQDKADLANAVVDRATYGPPPGVPPEELPQILWLEQFEKIDAQDGPIPATDRLFAYWGAPTIASVSDSPDPVVRGNVLTLTANGVSDDHGVASVSFYRDVNGNNVGDPGELLGTDTSAAGGWVWSGAATWAPGTSTYLAQATDDGYPASVLTSPWVSTTGTVLGPNQPPAIASLSDSPDPVVQGNVLTLTANGVSDDHGVASVSFYRDANGNNIGDPGELLGTDTSAAGGWVWSGAATW